MKNQRICIIGDGLTGLTTALAMSNLNVDIDLYFSKKKTINHDKRITAISNSNYNFLADINKSNIKKLFWPCKKIHLFYQRNTNIKNFLNFSEKNTLMHIFENNKFKKELLKQLKRKNVKFINYAVKNIDHTSNRIKIHKKYYNYDLIILCLGNNSRLYNNIIKNRSIYKDYKEIAITGLIKHKEKILNPSQFFLNEGPLAILPFNKNNFSFVWSLKKNFFNKNSNNMDILVKNKIEDLFNKKNKFKISKIQAFPIQLNLNTKYYKNNILILGEGLHSVHPIAGQGFNLTIRDIYKIYQLIKNNINLGLPIKNSFILKDFSSVRKPENTLFGIGIDITNSFFKRNKYFEPIKGEIIDKISKFKYIKKISKIISDKGISI